MPENLLASFSIVKQGETTFYVKNNYKDVLLSLDIESLRKEAIGKGSVRSGREPHAVIPLFPPLSKGDAGGLPELADKRIIIRHSRHGGLFGYIADDIFCKGNRFINELITSETAIEKGVNTAEIIAVIKHKVLGPFYRIDVLSKEIPDSLDLVELLTNPSLVYSLAGISFKPAPTFTERRTIIETVARTVRKMHDTGLYHADLHLKNILIQSTSGDTPPCPLLLEGRNTPPSPIPSIKRGHTPFSPLERGDGGVLRGEKGVCEFKAYVIDMDKAKLMDVVSTKLRMRNLSRLNRSVEKLKVTFFEKKVTQKTLRYFRKHPPTLFPSKTDKLRFFMAYIDGDVEMKQYMKMRIKTYWLHRLLWWCFSFFEKQDFEKLKNPKIIINYHITT